MNNFQTKMLTILVIALAGIFVVHGAPQDIASQNDEKIVGGSNANPEQYPFQISLQYNGRHRCGGSILTVNYCLTAAHCVDGIVNGLVVLAGTVSLTGSGQRRDVINYKMHENYSPSNYWRNDIAVLQLANPLSLGTAVQPVPLLGQGLDTPGGTPATVIGWGLLQTGGSIPDRLQTVDIQVYSDADCNSIHGGVIQPTNICAGVPEGGKGQCNGDSGGPLIANGNQVGVVSWSVKPCTIAPYPGVYTQVTSYIDWIKKNTDRP